MSLLERLSQSMAVRFVLSPKVSLSKRNARRTLEAQLRTKSDFSIVEACDAQDVLGTPEVIGILEHHGAYEVAANIGYGLIQILEAQSLPFDSFDKLTTDYLARLRHEDRNELRKLTWGTIQNYLKSARNKPNPFRLAVIAAIIAEKFYGIDETVRHLEQNKDYWGAACLCEGYISPVTALDREEFDSPLKVEAAARKRFAQRAIGNYLRSTPKDVRGAVRISFHVFGEPGALEICKRYGFDFNSAVDARELQMIEYHRELEVMASQPYNPEAFRQLIIKNKGILRKEVVSKILETDNLHDFLDMYNQRIKHHRAVYLRMTAAEKKK